MHTLMIVKALSRDYVTLKKQMTLEDNFDVQPQHLRDHVISYVDMIRNSKFDNDTKKKVINMYSGLLNPVPSDEETAQAIQQSQELAEALYP